VSWEQVQRVGDRLTPRMRRDIEAVLRRAQDRVPVSALVAVIERHGMTSFQVEQMLAELPVMLQHVALPLLRQAASEAGRLESLVIKDLLHVAPSLTRVNQLAVEVARRQSARLVTGVTARTRHAIRTITALSIKQGIPPLEAARLIKLVIGLTERQATAVVNYRFRLQDRGVATARVAELARRYAAKLLRQRSITIARTELIDSLNGGQQATWDEGLRTGLLTNDARKKWIITPDDRLCPLCAQMVGERALAPVDGFFNTPLGQRRGPTMHPNCRCAVVLVPASVTKRRAA
jgi:hypothetical protein